jgi:pyruvate/2-oxoglutarate dehydrogenase complex dihydrolipoamide acyltransferase (E2) component
VTKKPVVVDDKIVIRDMMSVVFTFDHRFGDAAIIGQFCQIVKECLEDPENFKADKYPQLPFYEDIDKSKKTQ